MQAGRRRGSSALQLCWLRLRTVSRVLPGPVSAAGQSPGPQRCSWQEKDPSPCLRLRGATAFTRHVQDPEAPGAAWRCLERLLSFRGSMSGLVSAGPHVQRQGFPTDRQTDTAVPAVGLFLHRRDRGPAASVVNQPDSQSNVHATGSYPGQCNLKGRTVSSPQSKGQRASHRACQVCCRCRWRQRRPSRCRR